LPTDVRRPADLARLREATLERFGAASVLMNNAGVGGQGIPKPIRISRRRTG
jgi:NAD(P)-dependent dehydrogenase (short-subunit alcohol dehydrogenase family)